MPPREGFTVAHFLTVADIDRSAHFYETVFAGRILSRGDSKGAPPTRIWGAAVAVAWVPDAFAHLKVIGVTSSAQALLDAAGVMPDEGIVMGSDPRAFLAKAAAGRIWEREPSVRTVY
jgi:hypothetical protein